VSTRSKVSLELVDEFFEVRTQVDRDLTTVSWVDRRLGLIKNLGRHKHGSGRAGVGNTLVPKGDHLLQRWRSVAHLTEGLPQNAGKTLLVKGIGMNGTVHVDLVDRWLRHLYKKLGTTR
jgi:hypothetical protein